MGTLLKISSLACLLIFVVGCQGEIARLRRTYSTRVSGYEHRNFEELRRQLTATKKYRGYRRRQLQFKACDTKSGYGLYFAVMPDRCCGYNVEIPCLIAPDTCLLNGIYFHGQADGDATKLVAALDSSLHELVVMYYSVTDNFFTQPELDSIRSTFLRGGFIVPKPGRHVSDWR